MKLVAEIKSTATRAEWVKVLFTILYVRAYLEEEMPLIVSLQRVTLNTNQADAAF